MAWLHAVPKPAEGTKREQHGIQAAKLSRLDRLNKAGAAAPMPPNPLPHVIRRLIEMGITEAAGMGVAPISWTTLDAWQRTTGVPLSAWEARLIRQLSLAYVAESRKAESETCPPPWRIEVTASELEVAETRLRLLLG